MPKFTYFPGMDENDDYTYVTSEKIVRHKPKQSNHNGKSQPTRPWNNGWN